MPNFTDLHAGILRPYSREPAPNERFTLSVERFAVPELLFYPSNVGIEQSGISETIANCLSDVCAKHPG